MKEPDYNLHNSRRPVQDSGRGNGRKTLRRGHHPRNYRNKKEELYFDFCPNCIINSNNILCCKIKLCKNYVPDYTYYPYNNKNNFSNVNVKTFSNPNKTSYRVVTNQPKDLNDLRVGVRKVNRCNETTLMQSSGCRVATNDLRVGVMQGLRDKRGDTTSNMLTCKFRVGPTVNNSGVRVREHNPTTCKSRVGLTVNNSGVRVREYNPTTCKSRVGLTVNNSGERISDKDKGINGEGELLGINSSSSTNPIINTDINNNNIHSNYNKKPGVVRDSQSLSGCNSGHPDQSSRFKNSNNLYLHTQCGEVRQGSYGEQRGVGQFQPHPYRLKSNQLEQGPIVNHNSKEKEEMAIAPTPKRQGVKTNGKRLFIGKEEMAIVPTPKRQGVKLNGKKLFNETDEREEEVDIVPLDTDLEFLLINSGQITAVKVQTIINEFMTNKKYNSIFCMTETKVRGHNFQPIGIKMFVKHREANDKKGGGLALGYEEKANIKMEEIKTGSTDILGIEGKIFNKKCRIILCYFDCTKQLSGKDYERNRMLQTKVENLMEVDPDTLLMVLGDMNGRLVELEPNIKSDANGEMVKSWVEKKNMIHLNTLDTCKGKYTFSTINGKSAIDHVLVNENMRHKHLGMCVDEDKTMLDISDHNLVRIWFRMGNNNYRGGKKKPRERITWISRHPTNIAKCVQNVKARIGRRHGFKHCMEKITTAVKQTMKRTKLKRPGRKWQTIRAAPWVDKELIENVSLRSKFSREWRYARKEGNQEKIEKCEEKYKTQKAVTHIITGNKKSEWEGMKIKEMEKNPAALWKDINLLLGKEKQDKEEAFIYEKEEEKQEIMECKTDFMEKWNKSVYQRLAKADFTFWSKEGGKKEKMLEQMKNKNSGIMENPIITEEEFVSTINNMKNKKATGIDNIPAELMKELIKDKEVKEYLLKCFNNALVEEVHKDWLVSRTTMIPKKPKPKILEHRPIAVTVNSNKIVCTILREKIEEHLSENGVKFDNQMGFTAGGRVEHCMFTLGYIANITFEKRGETGSPLYFAFIDFKKAYDSIDRKKLIEVLISYKINPRIIDLIVQMYRKDYTIVKLGKMEAKTEVTGGIRQGCSISTLLFKLITFKVIEDLRKIEKYNVGVFEDNSLWFADDATLIAKSKQILHQLLRCLEKSGRKYGLEINKEKTKIVKIRGKEDNYKINGYEMVQEAEYLGITVIGEKGREIFQKENEIVLKRSKIQVGTIMGNIRKSADKVLIGKAVWKQKSIPAILYGRAILPTPKYIEKELQEDENRVWKHTLGIGGYSTVAALRGEIGSSLMRTRIMNNALQYVRSALSGKFVKIKEMMEDVIRRGKGKWYKTVNSYIEELNITWDMLYTMTKKEIKVLTNRHDDKQWEDELNQRKTLKYYKAGKKKIGYDHCYRNNVNSQFLAMARTNAIELEEAKKRGNNFYNATCKLCNYDEEDLVHFVIQCPKLESLRNKELIDENITDPEERLIHTLFEQKRYQETGQMLKRMWYKRKYIMDKKLVVT